MPRYAVLLLVAMPLVVLGCTKSEPVCRENVSLEQAIHSSGDVPVEQSIEAVAQRLANLSVLVGTDGTPTGWKTGQDRNGDTWAFFYTDESHFTAAMKERSHYVKIGFADAFSIVEKNPKFRGIQVNSASEDFYPILREFFPQVRRAIETTKGTRK